MIRKYLKTHLCLFTAYNGFYILVILLYILDLLTGGILVDDFTLLGFTKIYFIDGELYNISAWQVHLFINLVILIYLINIFIKNKKRWKV